MQPSVFTYNTLIRGLCRTHKMPFDDGPNHGVTGAVGVVGAGAGVSTTSTVDQDMTFGEDTVSDRGAATSIAGEDIASRDGDDDGTAAGWTGEDEIITDTESFGGGNNVRTVSNGDPKVQDGRDPPALPSPPSSSSSSPADRFSMGPGGSYNDCVYGEKKKKKAVYYTCVHLQSSSTVVSLQNAHFFRDR